MSDPGLLITKGASGAGETGNTQQQTWSEAQATAVTLNGTAQLTFWSGIETFGQNTVGEVMAFLLDWASNGSGCTRRSARARRVVRLNDR